MTAEASFYQRFVEMLHICGPQSWPSLFATEHRLVEAKAIVNDAARRGTREAIDAQRLLNATLHPDTGQPILLPFRMAAHVPVNTALLVGMMWARSPFGTGLWQFFNATFNVCQFYANRNRSNEVPDEHVMLSYLGAMTSSVATGVLLRRYFMAKEAAAAHLPISSFARRAAYLGSASVPFLAAVAGKPLQIGIMRQDEILQGVDMRDHEGNVRGSSKIAGSAAIGMTVFSRVVYLAPMLWLPLMCDGVYAAFPAIGRSAMARNVTAVTLTALSSAFVTPACMAIFNQRAELPVTSLEQHLQGLMDSRGAAVERLYFNKGL